MALYVVSNDCSFCLCRTLIASRPGLCWCPEVTEDIASMVSDYTTQLMNGGLAERVLAQLTALDWTKELAALQRAAALGKHSSRFISL